MIFHSIYSESPLGTIHIYATQKGICSVQFTPQIFSHLVEDCETDIIKECRLQLSSYFHKEIKQFLLPTDISGTCFQQLVWNELTNIDYGETISYKRVATSIGKPQASRAVGNACRKNQLLVIIPCHRVVRDAAKGTDTLAGYAGELWRKQWLLAFESECNE